LIHSFEKCKFYYCKTVIEYCCFFRVYVVLVSADILVQP
jgi:hypothetical protein